MNRENPLPVWARNILIGIGLFLAGAVLAFGYSYRPLHGALSWQVEQLEARLDERNLENLRLSDSLANQESIEATRIDPETLAQVKRELDQTKRVLAQAEKDLRRSEGKRKDANASAATWRKRFKEIEGRSAPVASSSPPENPTPITGTDSPASATPRSAIAPSAGSDSARGAIEPVPETSVDGSQAIPERGIIPAATATESVAP